jgi:hypothetical protein
MKRTVWSGAAAGCALAGLLAACGGGDSTPPPSSGTCAPSSFTITADPSVAVGKAAGAVIASSCGPISELLWRQTAGPAVPLLSQRTQAISFEPPAVASYSFAVSFRDIDGVQRNSAVTINAVAPTAPVAVLARSDQAVREGGRATVRAWPPVEAGETVTWTQVSGPPVTLDTSDPNRVLFTAPAVTQDTVLVLRATKQLIGGGSDTDDVLVLVENYEQAPADPANTGPYVFSDLHVSRVYAYRASSPYAGVLTRCTFDAQLQYFGAGSNLCPLTTLPFLEQTTAGALPTVEQVMNRVLVSHDWMGDAFQAMLREHATPDLLRLFNGVTAVVIGAHIRPSYYYALTGAIYIDANNLWLSAHERDVISEAPDFRSEFDRDLQYSTVWRYVQSVNGLTTSIFVPFPATSRIGRELSYLPQQAGWLLYHELGHAADFFPPARRGNVSLTLTPWQIIGPIFQARELPSDLLAAQLPLQSQPMFALAQVKFFGAQASETQKSYTPQQVAGFFAPDRATDDYNYATTREDFAMVFEEFMMFRNHQWRRDFAVTDKIAAGATSASVIVRWGQRGRIGESNIKPRARLVVQNAAPWVDLNQVDALPPPMPMRAGESWADNLALPAPPPSGMAAIAAAGRRAYTREEEQLLLMRDMTRGWTAGPGHGKHWSPNDRWIQHLAR